MTRGSFQIEPGPGMKTYRACQELTQKAGEQSGFSHYQELNGGKTVEVFEDPLASRPIQAVNLNRVDLSGKWVVDIDEDPETGEACLIFEDALTRSAIRLWVPSSLDRSAFVSFSISSAEAVEQRPNHKGISYETVINDKVVPDESALRRAERVAAKQLNKSAAGIMELLASLQSLLFSLQRRIGLTRVLSWVRF